MIPVLFACKSSVYRQLGVDVWDESRDARKYSGSAACVAHPPCRAWGQLRAFAKPREGERELATFAIDTVRRVGGVVEHPLRSRLWPSMGITRERDEFGGWLLPVLQSWWGHRAPKATGLYLVGVRPAELPSIPFGLGIPDGRVEYMGRPERERTPRALAEWLVAVARIVEARK